MAVTGVGAVLTVPGAPTMRVLSISAITETKEALDDSSLASTSHKEYVPDDLADVDAFEAQVYFDATAVPARGVPGTVTVAFPMLGSGSTVGQVTGSGFIEGWSYPELAVSQRTISTMTVRFDGKTPIAYTPEQP